MLNKNEITGLILAGGEGRRVGGFDKGLLEFEGVSLIERQLQWLKPQVETVLISANRNLPVYQDFGYSVLPDNTNTPQGPLQGVLNALSVCKTRYLFVHPIDVPNLPSDTLQQMITRINNQQQVSKVSERGWAGDFAQTNASSEFNKTAQEAKPLTNGFYLKSASREHYLSMLINIDHLNKLKQFMESNNKRVGLFHQVIHSSSIDLGLTEDCFRNLNFTTDYA